MNKSTSKQLPALWMCIALDLVGMMSFTIPFIGEFSDVIWAPLSGAIYYSLFGGRMGKLGGIFSFIEEALPGLDIIPTFTISWFLRRKEISKNTTGAIRPDVIIIPQSK